MAKGIGIALAALALAVLLAGGPRELLRAGGDGDGGCPGSTDAPTKATVEAATRATLCLLNRERRAHGLRRLRPEPHLDIAAVRHSEDMGARDFFAHESPDGTTPTDRIAAASFRVRGRITGENLAWGSGPESTPRRIVESWMDSAGHRENILRRRFTRIGIGITFDAPEDARGTAGVYTTTFAGPATRR